MLLPSVPCTATAGDYTFNLIVVLVTEWQISQGGCNRSQATGNSPTQISHGVMVPLGLFAGVQTPAGYFCRADREDDNSSSEDLHRTQECFVLT